MIILVFLILFDHSEGQSRRFHLALLPAFFWRTCKWLTPIFVRGRPAIPPLNILQRPFKILENFPVFPNLADPLVPRAPIRFLINAVLYRTYTGAPYVHSTTVQVPNEL
ncbi:hypothetical protein BJ165DRAFT_1070399 [Panaeolus papilionaceus]|nr:hypothetical protein BJ165DRAFT_1070399 [Panaeolus papilionaceus]